MRGVWLLALMVGCGWSAPKKPSGAYYESTAIRREVVAEADKAAYDAAVKKGYRGRPVTVLGPGRAARKERSLAVLQALAALSGEEYYGAEADLLVRVKGKGTIPVQVRISKKGAVEAWEGAPWSREAPPGNEALRSKFGTGPLKERGAAWTDEARRGLVAALSRLSAEERGLIARLPFIRTTGEGKGRRGAQHIMENCVERIELYDRALLSRGHQFAGDPDHPMPAFTLTLLHELGHALHARPGRLAYCQYEQQNAEYNKGVAAYNAEVKRYNAAVKARDNDRARSLAGEVERRGAQLKRDAKAVESLAKKARKLVDRGPVLSAYAKALGKGSAPTAYGQTSLKESFAESFALYKADPGALKRLLPKVLAWFEGGGHLRALGG